MAWVTEEEYQAAKQVRAYEYLQTVIQHIIPDSPLVQISPDSVEAVIGCGQRKGPLF